MECGQHCLGSSRALMQASDDVVVIPGLSGPPLSGSGGAGGAAQSGSGAAAGDAAAAGGAQRWRASDEVHLLLTLTGAHLLLLAQCGAAMVEAGSARAVAAAHVFHRVLLQTCLAVAAWWALGHALAAGERQGSQTPAGFIGGRDFFLAAREDAAAPDPSRFAQWAMHAAFAASAAAGASAALAERGRLAAHAAVAVAFAGFVAAVPFHWVWSTEGWLSARREAGGPVLGGNGLIDVGGATCVHLLAGVAAAVGAYAIGPRQGRFASSGAAQPMGGGSAPLAAAGVVVRWLGFYGLVAGNVPLVASANTNAAYVASRAAASVTLAGAAGALAAAGAHWAVTRRGGDQRPLLEGALAGLVAASAGAPVIEPYAAFVIGVVGGLLCLGSSWAARAARLDDPAGAVATQLLPGLWGALAPGFFASPALLALAGYASASSRGAGLFHGGSGRQLMVQAIGAVVVGGWGLAWSALLFGALRRLRVLRISSEDEAMGARMLCMMVCVYAIAALVHSALVCLLLLATHSNPANSPPCHRLAQRPQSRRRAARPPLRARRAAAAAAAAARRGGAARRPPQPVVRDGRERRVGARRGALPRR